MASIVQRNKSFSVVYTIYDGDKKKQKWETYHPMKLPSGERNNWT
nr:hypothetical protein [Clostridium sp. OM04-12AA]